MSEDRVTYATVPTSRPSLRVEQLNLWIQFYDLLLFLKEKLPPVKINI